MVGVWERETVQAGEVGKGETEKDLNASPVSWYLTPRQQEANKDL